MEGVLPPQTGAGAVGSAQGAGAQGWPASPRPEGPIRLLVCPFGPFDSRHQPLPLGSALRAPSRTTYAECPPHLQSTGSKKGAGDSKGAQQSSRSLDEVAQEAPHCHTQVKKAESRVVHRHATQKQWSTPHTAGYLSPCTKCAADQARVRKTSAQHPLMYLSTS
uniref:Uncharacterized protein n=1 Tax=Eutreptiella gymnastica TaxID=73025 RepID=A0A7S1NKF6_9EUGL